MVCNLTAEIWQNDCGIFTLNSRGKNGGSLSDAFIMQENSNILSKEGELILEINQRVETNGRVEFCFGVTLKSYSDLLQ